MCFSKFRNTVNLGNAGISFVFNLQQFCTDNDMYHLIVTSIFSQNTDLTKVRIKDGALDLHFQHTRNPREMLLFRNAEYILYRRYKQIAKRRVEQEAFFYYACVLNKLKDMQLFIAYAKERNGYRDTNTNYFAFKRSPQRNNVEKLYIGDIDVKHTHKNLQTMVNQLVYGKPLIMRLAHNFKQNAVSHTFYINVIDTLIVTAGANVHVMHEHESLLAYLIVIFMQWYHQYTHTENTQFFVLIRHVCERLTHKQINTLNTIGNKNAYTALDYLYRCVDYRLYSLYKDTLPHYQFVPKLIATLKHYGAKANCYNRHGIYTTQNNGELRPDRKDLQTLFTSFNMKEVQDAVDNIYSKNNAIQYNFEYAVVTLPLNGLNRIIHHQRTLNLIEYVIYKRMIRGRKWNERVNFTTNETKRRSRFVNEIFTYMMRYGITSQLYTYDNNTETFKNTYNINI